MRAVVLEEEEKEFESVVAAMVVSLVMLYVNGQLCNGNNRFQLVGQQSNWSLEILTIVVQDILQLDWYLESPRSCLAYSLRSVYRMTPYRRYADSPRGV